MRESTGLTELSRRWADQWAAGRSLLRQGCKIRSGRDRIIRIIAIGIWSEIIKILLAFLESKWKNTGEIRFYEKTTRSRKSRKLSEFMSEFVRNPEI